MSFSLLCGCDANISRELSEPSFSSPDRCAVTLPPFIKQKQIWTPAQKTKDRQWAYIPHVLGRERKAWITNWNRKGTKRKSLRVMKFFFVTFFFKENGEWSRGLYISHVAFGSTRLPAADVVLFGRGRNMCAAAFMIIVAVLFSLCLFHTGHKLRFHSVSFRKR